MPRQRSPNRDRAKEMYMQSNGTIKLKDIATKLNVSDVQIRKWKSQDKWDDILKGTLPNVKRNVTIKKIQKKKAQEDKKETIEEEAKQENRNALIVDKLTERQRRFAEIFVRTPIAYKAAIKAGYSSNCAFVEGSRLLTNAKVRAYIDYLKELKRESILLGEEDIVDMHMRIAFADITDFVTFGQEKVPFVFEDPLSGAKILTSKKVSTVKLKEDFEVDGEIISEVSKGKDGVKVKLHDKMKSLQWLTDYFEMNPEFKYRREQDYKKLQLEREKFEHNKEMDEFNKF